jgi:hypothetical protein
MIVLTICLVLVFASAIAFAIVLLTRDVMAEALAVPAVERPEIVNMRLIERR